MIPGYTINESLSNDHEWQLLRCVRTEDNLPVLIRAARSQSPKPQLFAQLESEFAVLQGLSIPGVLRAHNLLIESDRTALVLEDPGGMLLSDMLESGQLTVPVFLRAATQITAIVAELHQRGIIHTRLRPEVFYLDEDGRSVWLVGLEQAAPTTEAPGTSRSIIKGDLAHVAPEQTGRIVAEVDHRTDLYLLGLIFYEMLTGRPSFEAQDPLELVHCQLARMPRKPSDVDNRIPQPLSEIVMRLLMKRASERYMSASGLLADLKQCDAQYTKSGTIGALAIAKHDRSDNLTIPEKLYGRSAETTQLLDAMNNTRENGPVLVFVAGYSGVGKTSLIRHLRDPVAKSNGYFVSGKYDQLERSNPYSAILQAFLELVGKILTETDSDIEHWRERIMSALGVNAQVIIEVIPELELIVGGQPPVPELKPTESQNRFNFYFQKFIAALARPERPLVLFLDDLQWASVASIRLLQSWVTGNSIAGLLVIGAYRSNEVDATHPLTSVMRELRETNIALQEIELHPLDIGGTSHIVRDALQCSAEQAAPLAKCVYEKTNGNPFFARSFLMSLFEERLLRPKNGAGWSWDLEEIDAVIAADNVVDLMARKLEKLPEDARDILKVAACIGGRIELSTLATACDKDGNECLGLLETAIASTLIKKPTDQYLTFYHDRVQEAAYGMIPDSARAPLHYRIGSLLLASVGNETLDETLFETVNHLNIGAGLIGEMDARERLAQLNLRAGLKAKVSTAYASAHDYFGKGLELLTANRWEDTYALAFDLHREYAECAYLCGEFDEAEKEFDLLMTKARTTRERGIIYNLRIVQYENMSRFAEASALGREAVALFDIEFPDGEEQKLALVDQEISEIREKVTDTEIADLVKLPRMQDADKKICIKLLMTMWAPTYISGDIPMTMLIAARMVQLSLQYGNAEESAYGYVTHAIAIAGRTGDYARAYDFGQLAMSVNEELDDLSARAKVNHMFSCYIGLWRDPIKECFKYSRAGYEAGIESGDFTYGGYSGFHESWHALFSAMPLDRYIDEYSAKLQFLSGYKYKSIGDAHQLMLQWGRCLQGETDSRLSLDGNGFSESEYIQAYQDVPFFIAFYYVAKLNICYLMQDYPAAARFAELAEKVIFGVHGMIWDALLCFNQALALTAAYDSMSENAQSRALRKLEELQEKMGVWAANSPENFSHQHKLIKAEIERVRGNLTSAQAYFEQAIEGARRNDFVNVRALASELAGRLFRARGRQTIAAAYLQDAAGWYGQWGARGKLAQMTEMYESFIGNRQAGDSVEWEPSTGSLDVAAILKGSQAISGEIIVDQLVERLMRVVLEDAGAERALLLCPVGNEWRMDAAGEVDENGVSLHVGSMDAELHEHSRGVINYVGRTREYLLSGDAQQDNRLTGDRYIQDHEIKSILCVPIVNQRELTAILYLENNLIPNAFKGERALIVQALAAQTAIALKNASLYADVVKEIEERRRAESALRVIASGTASYTGEDFFKSLVQSLADSLEVKAIFVSECIDPGNLRVRTMAFMNDGEFVENIEYDLKNTPCEGVIGGEVCFIPAKLEELYPVETGFQSYLGVPAVDLSGRVLGHLAILDTSDMSHLPHAESILQIFATRVGVELQRKRMQEELQTSEENYRLLVDNQTDLVVKLDPEGRLQFVSPSYCDTFSCTEQNILGTSFRKQIHSGDFERVERDWKNLFVAPWVAQFEHRATSKTGECWLAWALRAVRGENGDIVEIVGVGRDVTARRQAEEDARKNLHTLAHAGRMRSMGEMASNIAHELNQPLTAILSFSQASRRVLANDDFDKNELSFALDRIAVNAKRAGDIISHMRGFIRKAEPRTESSDINVLAREAMDLVNSELLHLEIDTVLDLQPALPAVRVDPIQIQQVILNLVRNSMEAIANYGSMQRRITISTRLADSGVIEVAVSDTGPGLDAKVAEKVFDAFITTKPEGMGIGLSICQSIVEAHGSELEARQRTGDGAIFSFELHADSEPGDA